MDRVSRAGISRSEPLDIEVSTAGDDPQSYGRERYEYAKAVMAGEKDDHQTFAAIYEAPQDLRDEDLAADPCKYGRMANPAWGHTVREKEYLADYHQSRGSLSALSLFRKYRLDIWSASETPWLNMSDWRACELEDFDPETLNGEPCYGGLDLAKTRDTTAFVLVFPRGDGEYIIVPHFWLPEETAARVAHIAPYKSWAHQGFVTLTDGAVCDYERVRDGMNEARAKYNLIQVGFDRVYATPLMQRLMEEDGWDPDMLKEYPQTIVHLAGPTAAFERLVIERKLRHGGNALMTWQAGSTKVKADLNDNKRPVKQKHGDHRTIDGVVAGIMALQLALDAVDTAQWYTPGMLTS
jgi:phage terminase large subunit-like protein